jgi:hypothetical protein
MTQNRRFCRNMTSLFSSHKIQNFNYCDLVRLVSFKTPPGIKTFDERADVWTKKLAMMDTRLLSPSPPPLNSPQPLKSSSRPKSICDLWIQAACERKGYSRENRCMNQFFLHRNFYNSSSLLSGLAEHKPKFPSQNFPCATLRPFKNRNTTKL